jgi:hypothetical protein
MAMSVSAVCNASKLRIIILEAVASAEFLRTNLRKAKLFNAFIADAEDARLVTNLVFTNKQNGCGAYCVV